MNPYNDSPEQAAKASVALMERSMELLQDKKAINSIWRNLGFHAATVRLRQTGCDVPIGPTAQAYIALVLAAAEHVHSQRLFDSALDEIA
ncbi:hypothetical protein LCGC14_1309190 [marine sediment metagenome]|uniref:Uncharacterized protein n=1 Tax=marine sediment metagenome TaxID=412755 RepID=A0A0F9KMX3_9ZZZZ